jgi:hypothetical protein
LNNIMTMNYNLYRPHSSLDYQRLIFSQDQG